MMKPTLTFLALLAAPIIAAAQVPPTPPAPPVPPVPPASSWREYSDAWKDWARNYSKAWKEYGDEYKDEYKSEYKSEKYHHENDNDDENDNDGETIDTTVSFSGSGGIVDLGIVSGTITVRGWSRNEAKIHATSEEGRIDFEHSSNRILLDVRQHHDGDSEFDITVPFGTRVLMRSTSGDLHSEGVKGPIEVRTVSGEVRVGDIVGEAVIEGVSGDIGVRNLEGNLRVNCVSGEIQLSAIHGDVDASTVSGDISLPNGRSRIVRMESVSGNLSYAGPVTADGRYDFHSHSGDVTLRMPSDVGASLSMETFSGSIDSEFRITITTDTSHHATGQHIETTLGHGGAHVQIETFSGDIRLEHLSSQ
jgi:DUF4097 and DUF4098 domain-containing protein YvlB